MDTLSTNFSLDQIAEYRQSAQSRYQEQQIQTELLRKKAWDIAKQAAQLLRTRFHAARVVVFGSLIHEGCFTRWSDVDLAAWGIPSQDTFRALGAVMDLSDEVEINLVDVNTCRSSLLEVIEKEGIDL
ncbi:MAG: nucleotidyltransferase domain-containing protein [Anaerolineales bacterium]|nr:nucleotidyltransferase domain-containing protein [Anaerolineales bacterium]